MRLEAKKTPLSERLAADAICGAVRGKDKNLKQKEKLWDYEIQKEASSN